PAAFSTDGTRLALAMGWGAIRLVDVATGQSLLQTSGHESMVDRLAYSPDGTRVASRSYFDRTIRLWDTATGKPLHAIRAHPPNGLPLAYTPDGKAVVSAHLDGHICFWDPASGKELRRLVLDHECKAVSSIGLGPDGRTLATVSSKADSSREGASHL